MAGSGNGKLEESRLPEEGTADLPRPAKKSARRRVMDLLARRNHSELELRQKLADDYQKEEIEVAIEFARESKWLLPADELSAKVANSLDRRRKGHRYIKRFLQSKGLPPVDRDDEAEYQKALAVAEAKLSGRTRRESDRALIDYEEQKKVHRWLASRGFDDDIIRRVINSFRT